MPRDAELSELTLLRARLAVAEEALKGRWRPQVVAFADAMEARLRANDHKGGWDGEEPVPMLKRVDDESRELSQEVRSLAMDVVWREVPSGGFSRGGWSKTEGGKHFVGSGYRWLEGEALEVARGKVLHEAADLANMALIVADLCGALPTEGPSGVDARKAALEAGIAGMKAAVPSIYDELRSNPGARDALRRALSSRKLALGHDGEQDAA